MHCARAASQQGLTLIEMITVVAILGIIAAVAIPAYDAQKRKGYRADAISALTQAAQLQERWYTDKGTYAANLSTLGMASTSENDKYTLAVTFSAGTPDEFTVTATATGGQTQDTQCRTLSLDEAGRKRSTDSSGSSSDGCWPR